MADPLDVAVVGAGPFGLSVAAQLAPQRVRTFGEPMRTWRTLMPPDMLLRSAWHETSMSSPGGEGSIDAWSRAAGEPRVEPIPLAMFLRYAEWFRDSFVPDSDPADIVSLDGGGPGYRLMTDSGGEIEARSVVLAVGVTPFAYAPPAFSDAIGEGVEFATGRQSYERYRGRRVIVIGGGQGGLESAAQAARAGAEVEILVRSSVRWFADREPHHQRGPVGRRLYELAYPVIGYGPPPINRIVRRPDLFAALPGRLRSRLNRRLLRAGGSPWLRGVIEDAIPITEGVAVEQLERTHGALRLSLSDGSVREVDNLILATGYRFALERLQFLSPEVRQQIVVKDGWPVLDRYFRSTAPGIFMVGYPSEYRFGPLSRFVGGTHFASSRLAKAAIG